MSCHIITQHKAKKGRSEELIALVRHSLSESMLHGGALTVSYQQNQDDPDDLISDQYWETRKHYEDYFKWRADNGSGAKFQDLCAEPISYRFFNVVSEPTNENSPNKPHACHIIIQHKTKNGRSNDLVELIRHGIRQSMLHEGCFKVSIQQNQDDPNDIISDQYWETRKHYEDYFKSWVDAGDGAQSQEMCMEPISSRFFSEVLSGASPSGS